MGNIGNTAALLQAAAQPEPSVRSLRPGHEVDFKLRHVDPPSPLYVTDNDDLLITLAGLSSAAVAMEVRYLTTSGEISVQEELLTGPNSRTPARRQFGLTESYILSVSLQPQSAALFRGQLYGSIALVRSQGPAVSYTYQLAQGYLGLLNPVRWPNPMSDWSTLGAGFLTLFTLSAPAAGAEWSYTPAANVRQRIVSIRAALTTSAAVANRQVSVQITQGGQVIARLYAGAVQAASLSRGYTIIGGVPVYQQQNELVINFGNPLSVTSNVTLASATTSIDAADQWSTVQIGTEDWLDE